LYDRFLVHHPPNVDVLLVYAQLRRRVGAAPTEVEAVLQCAASADGLRIEPHLMLAQSAANEKNWSAAKRHAELALRRQPNAVPALLWAARAAQATGDRASAARFTEKILTIDPNHREAQRLAAALRAAGS
jgi:tetratricopeptide (TPR) repeat protein